MILEGVVSLDEIRYVMDVYEAVALFRLKVSTRVIMDEKLLFISRDEGIALDVFALQAMFTEWEESHVKVVWLNNFSAKYGLDFGRWLSHALAMTISDDRFHI